MTRAAAAFVAALCFGPPAAALEPRAEIQINLCSAPSEVKDALKLGEKGRPTIVWLFDTPSLALQSQGLRLRLRESGKNSDLTLKAAGQDCRALDPPLRPPDGKCEADLHGDSFDDVVSLTRRIDASERRALSAAPASGAALAATIGSLLTREQRALLETRRADSGSSLLPADIVRLGPSSVVSLASKSQPYEVEIWTLPGDAQFVELSQKVGRDAALKRRDELLRELAARSVVVCPDQASQADAKLRQLLR